MSCTRRPLVPSNIVVSLADARAARRNDAVESCNNDETVSDDVQACKDLGKPNKTSKNKRATARTSRTGYPVTNCSSRATCTAYPPEEFAALVASLSVRKLRETFPHEHSCHTAMLARAKAGRCIVHPSMRSFKSFLSEIGPAPTSEHTVDRIDTHDHEYASGKVRWATKREQANNRSTTITLPFNGERVPLTVVAEMTGQKPDTMRKRLSRAGWRQEEVAAGQRASSAAPLTTEGWPAGATVSKWEGPYQGFQKTFGSKLPGRLSRAVFFTWIAGNMLASAERALEEEFPEHFSQEADPDYDGPLPESVLQHPDYQASERLRPMIDEARTVITADPAQLSLFRWMRREHRRIFNPKDAIKAMSKPSPRPSRLF